MWALETEHVLTHFFARGKFCLSHSLALLYGIFIRISSASTWTNTAERTLLTLRALLWPSFFLRH